MDLDAILAGIAERDKWQSRLETLQRELRSVKAQRRRVAARLRRLGRELKRLQTLSEELVRNGPAPGRGGWGPGGPPSSHLPVR
jgi:chromosome segregation ATPase